MSWDLTPAETAILIITLILLAFAVLYFFWPRSKTFRFDMRGPPSAIVSTGKSTEFTNETEISGDSSYGSFEDNDTWFTTSQESGSASSLKGESVKVHIFDDGKPVQLEKSPEIFYGALPGRRHSV